MNRAYEFKSACRALEKKNLTTSGCSKDIHTRRRLFRQPKSCPHFSIKVDQGSLVGSCDNSEPFYFLRKSPMKLNIDELLTRVAKFEGNRFIYLNYSVDMHNVFFTPYSFKEVSYSGIDRQNYFTISRNGVSRWNKKECSFTPLDLWEKEYRLYSKIVKIPLFSTFRKWKSFKQWSKLIKWRNYQKNRNSVAKALVLIQPNLSEATMIYRRIAESVHEVELFNLKHDSGWQLQDLVEHQKATFKKIREILEMFFAKTSDTIETSTLTYFKSKGFYVELVEVEISPMKFLIRLKKRKTCEMICRYLRFIDHMTMDLLYEVILRGSEQLLRTIEESSQRDSKTPLLTIQISFVDQELIINPTQKEVLEALDEIIDQSLDVVKLNSFQEHEMFSKFTRPIIGGRRELLVSDKKDHENVLNIVSYFCDDDRLAKNRSRIIAIVTESFNELQAYLGRFKNYLLLYSTDLQENYVDLESLVNVQELRRFCERYTGQMRDIAGIEQFKNLGIFLVDQRCFHEVMTPLYQRLYSKICVHVPVLLSDQLTETNDSCQEIMGTLLTPPEGTSGLVEYLFFLDRCGNDFLDVTDKLATVEELLELIATYEIDAGDDINTRFKSCSEFLANCKDAHSKKLNQKVVFMDKLSQSIDKDVLEVYNQVTEIKSEITKEWILSEDSQPMMVKDTLTTALEQLQLSNEKLIQLQSYCEVMELELIDLSVFVDVQVDARIRLNLWENLEEWTDSIQDWYTKNFYLLDIEEMKEINQKIRQNCIVFGTALPGNVISPKLQSSVELFSRKVDIISQLRNETLKERHWTVIEDMIDRKIVENDSITIRDFEEVGVFEDRISRKLVEISNQARAEQQLEEQLSGIERFWMGFHLQLKKYRYHRNVFILDNIEEVSAHLDDSFVKINVIRSSTYVEPIRDRIEKWIVHLNLSTETLSEWSLCQTNWNRLEYLFSLPGIEFKIPEELSLFKAIDAVWRSTMLEVSENSLALVALLRPGRLKSLQECNERIQELTKQMKSYLNTRRMNYPRLYFLSDLELMTILTEEPKNVQQVGKFLPKIFDSIFRLVVKRKDISYLLEPLFSITHMVNERGETIPLVDKVQIDGSTDQWLKILDMEMTSTIRDSLQKGYQSFDEEDIIGWGKDKLPQVFLLVCRLKLFKKIEDIGEDFLPKIDEILSRLIRYISDKNTNRVQRSTLAALSYTLIYYKQFLQGSHLLNETPHKWRYKWTGHCPILCLGEQEIPYFNEYISSGEGFLFNPESDRLFYHFQMTMKEGLNTLVSGAKGAGKMSTVRMLAKLVAKFTITFESNELNQDYGDFQRVLFGIVQTGSWCILKGLEKVPRDILSVIGDQLMLIKEAKMKTKNEIKLTGNLIMFDPWCQFFVMSNQFEDFPDSLKIYMREIKLESPNLEALDIIRDSLSLNEVDKIGTLEDCPTIQFEKSIFKNIITIIQGSAGVGKSKIWKGFVDNYNEMDRDGIDFKQIFINSLPMYELFGYTDHSNGEWVEGFLERTFLNFYKTNPVTGKLIIVLDGQIRPDWMNLLIGINERRRFLTLPNMSLLRIPDRVSIVIETEEIQDPVGYAHLHFIEVIKVKSLHNEDIKALFKDMIYSKISTESHSKCLISSFEKYYDAISDLVTDSHGQSLASKVTLVASVIQEQYKEIHSIEAVERNLLFSLLWTFGGALSSSEKLVFENRLSNFVPLEIRPNSSLWDFYFNIESGEFHSFGDLVPISFKVPPQLTLDLSIPTIESKRMAYVVKLLSKRPVLWLDTCRNYSLELIKSIETHEQELHIRMSKIYVSPTKTTKTVQRELERCLITRRKESIGPVIKSRHSYFIGDLLERNIDEDASEFLRQLIETEGYFDRETWNHIKLIDVGFIGVTSEITQSMRRLAEPCILIRPCMDSIQYFTDICQKVIISIGDGIESDILETLNSFPSLLTNIWTTLDLRYAKQYSIMNMKKIFISSAQPTYISKVNKPQTVIKLLLYEMHRTLVDSCKSEEQKQDIKDIIKSLFIETYGTDNIVIEDSTIFANFMTNDRIYEEITDNQKLTETLQNYFKEYNKKGKYSSQLFWHDHLITNLARICGLIRDPQYHTFIIGGVGKRLICRLAAFINNYKLIEVTSRDFHSKLEAAFESNHSTDKHLIVADNITDKTFLSLLENLLESGVITLNSGETSRSSKIQLNVILAYDNLQEYEEVINKFPLLHRKLQSYFLSSWGYKDFNFIASSSFHKLNMPNPEIITKLTKVSIQICYGFESLFDSNALSRKFLHMAELYEKFWLKKKISLEDHLKKTSSCINKLSEIKDKMVSEDLKKYVPQLEERKIALKEMRIKYEQMVSNCDSIRAQVVLDESSVKIQTAGAAEISDDVNKDLEIAMPALRAAQDQIKSLSKGDWNELRGQNNPVKLVVFVHEAVCILFKIKPDWPTARGLINDQNILTKLLEFDKENVSEMVLKKIKPYIDSKDFDPAKIEKVSKVSKCLCLWVKAIDQFAKVYKVVEPKARKQQNAEAALREAIAALRNKQQDLADAESKIQTLRDTIEEYDSSFRVLQENVDLINLRLTRASRITSALSEEDTKWTNEVSSLEKQLECLSTDALLISASVVFLGRLNCDERAEYLRKWRSFTEENDLKMSDFLTLKMFLGNDLDILQWHCFGLPFDDNSIENILTLKNSLRYPLLIDRDEIFGDWILKNQPEMKVLHHKSKDFDGQLKSSLSNGESVLVTEISEPIRDTLKMAIKGEVINDSGEIVKVHPSSFLYLSTKQDISHFSKETLINLNEIDCDVTKIGIEDRMLTAFSKVELRALEAQTREVESKIQEDCFRMRTLQDSIVQYLHESQGNILDNAELVASLCETKETYSIVVDRLADTRESEKVLNTIKEKYRAIAKFGVELWGLVGDLKRTNSVYSIPMDSFVEAFSSCVQKLEGESADTEQNLRRISETIRISAKVIFNLLQPRLQRQDQLSFARNILRILNIKDSIDNQCSEIEIEEQLGIKLNISVDFANVLESAHNPIVIIPLENSLEELITDLGAFSVTFIAVGSGNEMIVVNVMKNLIGKVLVLQNVHLNSNIVRLIEEEFSSGKSHKDYKLILVVSNSGEIPKSLLYNSSVIFYYGNRK